MRIAVLFGFVLLILSGCRREDNCTDPEAMNFNPSATEDDGSCWRCEPQSMDGYTYEVVRMGDQCWFAENLRTTRYSNGDAIAANLSVDEWTETSEEDRGACSVYGEGSAPCNDNAPDFDACDETISLSEYGRLYNWYAVNDDRGLCPEGWGVPRDQDWDQFIRWVSDQGYSDREATALKDTTGWDLSGNGEDNLGFAARPGGYRTLLGDFTAAGGTGSWWASTAEGGLGWARDFVTNVSVVDEVLVPKMNGLSVRCVRSNE